MAPTPSTDSGIESEIEFVDVEGGSQAQGGSSAKAKPKAKGEASAQKASKEKAPLDTASPDEKKQFLTLDDNGDKYIFPWEKCKTWNVRSRAPFGSEHHRSAN